LDIGRNWLSASIRFTQNQFVGLNTDEPGNTVLGVSSGESHIGKFSYWITQTPFSVVAPTVLE
jgi:hypothetical protein